MDEDYGRLLASAAGFFEQLPVYGGAIGRLIDHLFWRHKLAPRHVGGHHRRACQFHLASASRAADGQHRRTRHRGAEEGDGRAIARHHRRGLDSITLSQDFYALFVHRRPHHVPPIGIEFVRPGVGLKQDEFAVGRQADLFGHVRSRSQQRGITAAVLWNRVHMRPAILIGQENNAPQGGPMEVRSALRSGHGAAQRCWGFPDLLRRTARRGISRPNGPCRDLWRQYGFGRTPVSGRSHERQACAVR